MYSLCTRKENMEKGANCIQKNRLKSITSLYRLQLASGYLKNDFSVINHHEGFFFQCPEVFVQQLLTQKRCCQGACMYTGQLLIPRNTCIPHAVHLTRKP